MKRLQLMFFVCCCSSILAVTSCIKVVGYSCVSAYWDTVTCVLDVTNNPVRQSNATYSLKFIDFDGSEISCPLVAMNHSYSCVCKVTKGVLSASDEYGIKLCHESGCHPVAEGFQPSKNIQPTPPHEAEVHETPETFNITWKSTYERHRYLTDALDFELLLQTSQSPEIKTLHPNSHERSAWIPKSQLQPDATYCIKVRSITTRHQYGGTWSKWSPPTCWKNEAGGEQGEEDNNISVILIKYLGPVCMAVGVLLFVLFSPAVRMKIKTMSRTPSPAPFFQPLFQQHKGNVQQWLSPQGKCVLTYKTEEILTTDAVIVVPKPVTKDPDKNQDNPTVQLAFIQGQTSYVGLPGIHEASPPITMVCPGDTPYTQLPCSVWGVVGVGEVEAVSSLPKDFFNISHEDSGCSCEDLTQSPECSLPNSPVVECPPPSYCNNYCILNKTAEGFAPVLVVGSSLNASSDSLQEE